MNMPDRRLAAGVALLQAKDFAPVEEPLAVARVGVIANPRSYRNRRGARSVDLPQAIVHKYEPRSRGDIVGVLQALKSARVEMIVVDGGDGTVREVLGAANLVYGGNLPRFAVIPSGKTNALAHDLGIPGGWQLGDAIRAYGAGRVETRSPVRVHWTAGTLPDQFGFILGLGIFNRATMLAQRVHKRGWFNSAAVFWTVVIALTKAMFGAANSGWRRGDMVCVSQGGREIAAKRVFVMLASTLRRMPLGLRPFGPERDGLKFLIIDAPAKAIYRHAVSILRGTHTPLLEANGYHRQDVDSLNLQLSKNFVMDGEQFPGGNVTISRAPPIEFVVPPQG